MRALAGMSLPDRGLGGCSQFGNILELGPSSLVLEAPEPLETGERIALGFFLPVIGREDRTRHSLSGSVREVLDAEQLRYLVDFQILGERSQKALEALVAQRDKGEL